MPGLNPVKELAVISFQQSTATYLHKTFGNNLERICVVTPNRRSTLFLRKFLSFQIERPVWAPAIYPVEDFMTLLSGLQEVEPVHILPELYGIHRELEGTKAQSFEEFLTWAGQLIGDFNDIDRNLVDANSLFAYLDEAKAISLWNPEMTPLTVFQQNYLRFFKSLIHYYTHLTTTLLSRNTGYQGLIFRQATKQVVINPVSGQWDRLVFAGFSALTKAEADVMDHFHQAGKATFLWDSDDYYTKRPFMEAGIFLRKWMHRWPGVNIPNDSDHFLKDDKRITIAGIPDIIGQVKFCGELITKGLITSNEDTAIVVTDESLLLPLLNSIPARAESMNITMGLPLRQTPLAGLLDIVCRMHLHPAALQPSKPVHDHFYYTDIIQVLRHPVISQIANDRMKGMYAVLEELTERMSAGSRIFLSRAEISIPGLFNEGLSFLDPFFAPWNGPKDALRDLQAITGLARTGEIENENAFTIARLLHQIATIESTCTSWFTVEAVYQLYQQLVNSSSLPFYGEPLQGIQIMGMLETRTLDFKNLVILSCNEGILPSGKHPPSFIPHDIRREYQLPTFQQRDSVYAYHFYRLLQRAENIWLLYNTEPDKIGGGEPSRYLRQIRHELPLYNQRIVINDQVITTDTSMVAAYEPIKIEKDGDVLGKLIKKASDGFSPSTLNSFRSCPLKFYFSEIAGVREPEVTSDSIDSKELGTAVHHALFKLFEPIRNKPVSAEALDSMIKMADDFVIKAFEETYQGKPISTGKNLLMAKVATLMVRNFLKAEIKTVAALKPQGKFLITRMLEQRVSTLAHLSINSKTVEVKIKGVIDRVDSIGGVYRVVDYKTGRVEVPKLTVRDWNSLVAGSGMDQAFQIMTYAWLLAKTQNFTPLTAGIISLKQPGKGFMALTVDDQATVNNTSQVKPAEQDLSEEENNENRHGTYSISNEDMRIFEHILFTVISDIMNTEIPFVQTEDVKACKYCPYIYICGRSFEVNLAV